MRPFNCMFLLKRDNLKMGLFLLFMSLHLMIEPISCGSDAELYEAMKQSAKDQGFDPEDLKPGQILLTPPILSDEDIGSQFMPKSLRCDGCRAVAYQVCIL